jgi:nucleotide-binding universal stress UspA family protein
MKLDRIIVAVDGSENSLAAVGWAAGLAEATGAEVVAVHAVGLLEQLGADGEPVPTQPHRDDIQRQFEESWCAPLDQPGIRCRRLLRDGNPVSVLLAVADEEDADLLVLGSRGLGGYPEALLGSTSTQVAQHSTRPVTIVPSG